jgi:hypothetical protein
MEVLTDVYGGTGVLRGSYPQTMRIEGFLGPSIHRRSSSPASRRVDSRRLAWTRIVGNIFPDVFQYLHSSHL